MFPVAPPARPALAGARPAPAQAAATAPAPADVAAALDLLERAYSRKAQVEIVWRVARELPPEIEEVADAAPEMQRLVDPATGREFRFSTEMRAVVAPGGRLAVFRRSLQFAGDPESLTSLTLRTGEFHFDHEPRAPHGTYRRSATAGDAPYEQLVEWRDKGMVWDEWLGALDSVPGRVAHLLTVLRGADDATLSPGPRAGTVTIASAQWRSSATIDTTSGELVAAVLGMPNDDSYLYRVEQWHPSPVFPARHPRLERETYAGPLGDVEVLKVFDPVRVGEPDESVFQWWSYTERAWDADHERMLTAGNVESPELTSAHLAQRRIVEAEVRRNPEPAGTVPPRRRGVATNAAWALGVTCFALAIGIVLRRRFQR